MLSVVIPSHSRVDLLAACLESVLRHRAAPLEVVVVDDASPGGAVSSVASRYPEIRSARRERRGGFAAAANTGIRAATGDVIQLLNDDTEATPGWDTESLRWFDDPSVGAVAPLVLFHGDPRLIDSAGDCYSLGGVARKRGHRQPFGPDFADSCPVFGASASSAFYRRSALERTGLFPEFFGSYFEDVDLSFRIQRAGYRIVYAPGARVLHHVGASHSRDDPRLIEMQACNEERVFWRNMPAPALPRALWRHAIVLAAKACRRFGEGNLGPWLKGKWSVLREVRKMREHRRKLEALGVAVDPARWNVDA